MTSSPASRALRTLGQEIREARDQAKLGYEFSPNSYSYGALRACLAAEQAFDVLREALEGELGEERQP
jgi:hypothetical protein